MMPEKYRIQVVEDPAQLAPTAAGWITQTLQTRLQEVDRFSLVLSGGSTPQALYRQLANFPYAAEINWTHLHVFWGDERCVPPDHPQSNYRMACQALLDHVPVPPEHIHRMRGELPPEEAARAYAQVLDQFFGERQPQFDLVLLGMGADGHTASLFPHSAALQETQRWVVANYAPSQASWRITLTIPALNAAREVAFLVSGSDKASTLQRVLDGPYQPEELPAQFIQPAVWLVDAAAASRLSL